MEASPSLGLADLALLGGRSDEQLRDAACKLGFSVEQPSRLPLPARPGLSAARLLGLIDRTIEATGLDLSGLSVLTEAATGLYSVTAVIAARAGATRVHAVAKASRFGTVDDAVRATMDLATAGGVADRLIFTEEVPLDHLDSIDIVTNSGHLRPLTRTIIDRLPQSAVIALMYEAWEFRPGDLDLEACLERGIPVVGVNERDPSVDVFSYLGELCARHMQDAGVVVGNSRIALLCDNDFGEPIRSKLAGLGGAVSLYQSLSALPVRDWDCLVIALRPAGTPRIGKAEAETLMAVVPPGAVVVQLWGDVDRRAAAEKGLPIWPSEPPPAGHMAALLSDLGPDPVVRLQTGGLRAAECVRRGQHRSIVQLLQAGGVGERME